MFGGKKLKDLTEEDIRKYAESLSAPQSDSKSNDDEVCERPSGEDSSQEQRRPPERSLIRAQDLESIVEDEGVKLELARREGEEEEARRKKHQADMEAEYKLRVSREEELRREVLAELDRSQMPAIRTAEGLLQKAIEHYLFADAEDLATISIELDKDLFEGAAEFVSDQNVEVTTKETEVTILIRGLPASKTVATPAEWKLHLGPLFHSVDPDRTKWRIRKGKLSVKLCKRKKQEWRRLVKF